MLNKKMLLAPILAVSLVLSIAASVSYLPVSPQASPLSQSSPEPSPAYYLNVTTTTPNPASSTGSNNALTQTPAPVFSASTASPLPTTLPTAMPQSTSSPANFLPVLSILTAVAIGIIAALVFFSEKGLKKDLGRDGYS